MANPAAGIRAAVAARYPDAVVVERGLSHLRHQRVDPDGTQQFIYDGIIGALHYKDDKNAWQEIDDALEDDGADGFSVRTGATGHLLRMAADGKRRLYPNRYDLTRYVEFSGLPSPGTPQRGENYLAWDRSHFAAKIFSGGTAIKFLFTLKDSSAPTSISFNVALVGLTRSGRFLLADGVPVAEMRLPTAVDAAGTERDCTFTLSAGKVTIALDTAGLVFPIEIDPTINVSVAASYDDGYRYGASSFNRTAVSATIGYSAGVGYPYQMFARWLGVTCIGTITTSYIQLSPYDETSSGTPLIKIRGVEEGGPDAPTNYTDFDNDESILTSAGVDWDITWDSYDWRTSPSLNAIFQELADHSWPIINAPVMLQIRDDCGTGENFIRVSTWNDGAHGYAPKLHIEYTTNKVQNVAGALTMAGTLGWKVMRGVGGALAPTGALISTGIIHVGGTGNLIGTSTSMWATRTTLQRKGFYANGRFWAFYDSKTEGVWTGTMTYRSSVDGITWSDPTVIGTTTGHGSGSSVYYDGTYLHYSRTHNITLGGLYYRRGLPNSDGTITWSAEEQEIIALFMCGDPVIIVDSNGYPWVGYCYFPSGPLSGAWWRAAKSSTKDGTWTTEHTTKLAESYDNVDPPLGEIVALTGGKVYSVYIYPSGELCLGGQLWNGSSWGGNEVIKDTVLATYHSEASAISVGDDVYVSYLTLADGAPSVKKRTYGVGWGSEETVYPTGDNTCSPVLGYDAVTGDIYCFWESSPTTDHIYYKQRSAGIWSGILYDWIDEEGEALAAYDQSSYFARLTVFSTSIGAVLGVFYTTKDSSPYKVKLAILKMPPQNFYQAVAGALTLAGVAGRLSKSVVAGALATAGSLGNKIFTNLVGGLTSGGALVKKGLMTLGGALGSAGAVAASILRLQAVVGALTSSGALTTRVLTTLGGVLNLAGAVAGITTYLKALAGALTSGGALLRSTASSLAGGLATAGSLALKTFYAITGTLTSSGVVAGAVSYLKSLAGELTSSGAVGAIIVFVKGVGGTLTSAGDIARKTGASLAGGLTSGGTLPRKTFYVLAGALTSSGIMAGAARYVKSLTGVLTSSGAAGAIVVIVKSVGGTLTTAGEAARSVFTALVGTLTSSGSLVKRGATAVAGGLTIAGSLVGAALKSLTGALTSSGTLASFPLKALAGSLASAGDIARKTAASLAGGLTSAGGLGRHVIFAVAGSLASSGIASSIKVVLKSVDGALTSSGALVAKAQKTLAGALTSAGGLLRNISHGLTGNFSPSGAVATAAARLASLAGSLTSTGAIGATKALLKSVSGTLDTVGVATGLMLKALAGVLTSSGALSRKTFYGLSGVLNLAGAVATPGLRLLSLAGSFTATGAVGMIKALSQAVVGTLTSAGALTRLSQKALGGALTSAGALVGKALKSLAGALTPTGALSTLSAFLKSLSGALSLSGVLTTGGLILKSLTGALTSAGGLILLTQKALSGAFGPSGAVAGAAAKLQSLAGTLTSSGAVASVSAFLKSVSGVLTSSGLLTTGGTVLKSLAGALTSVGGLTRLPHKALDGALTSAGVLGRGVGFGVVGVLTSSGSLLRGIRTRLAGVLSAVGALISRLVGAPEPTVIELVGSYEHMISLAGSYIHTLALAGSYVPLLAIPASYEYVINLSGSYVPEVEMEASYG